MRYLFNFLQGIQLILNVGLIVISNGEALSEAAKFKLCFIVCCLIWALVGFAVGQIRTLQKFGWLANAAVWLNLMCMFITMGAAAHSPPNFAGAGQSAGAIIANGTLITPDAKGNFPPVQTSGGLPDTGGFVGSVAGAMQAIFAYGGSMIFPEFMAEMKRPRDFLKAMWAAQIFIYIWYVKKSKLNAVKSEETDSTQKLHVLRLVHVRISRSICYKSQLSRYRKVQSPNGRQCLRHGQCSNCCSALR